LFIPGPDPGAGSWIQILTFYPSRIPDLGVKKAPDPGVKKAPDPGSESATLDINFPSQVLNMLGKVVTMKPAALQKKRENKNTVALDSEQNAIQVNNFDFWIKIKSSFRSDH
jgi:hypothetical protein